jgi:chromosome segregation protein
MVYIKKLVMHGFKSFARETEIPLDKGMNVIVGPNGSGKSSSYDTIITLSDGREIQLGELVDNQIENAQVIKNLKDGIYVDGDNSIEILSLNKNTMKIEKKKVSKFIRREGDILYKIRTRTGKEVKATGCHPVMIFKDGKIKSVLIQDLKQGELIATPRKISIIPKNNFDSDIARLLGYIIGDGYIAKDRIEFVNSDNVIMKDFKNIINTKFKIFTIKERVEKNTTRIYIRNKAFVQFIRAFFNADSEAITSEKKEIPQIILSSNLNSISNILSGLYDTDGSVRKDIAIIEFCTKNKRLANQVQGLLLRLGIISKVKKRLSAAYNTQKKIRRDYFYVYIYGKENLQKFYDNIKLNSSHKNEGIQKHIIKDIATNPNTDLLPQETNYYIRRLANLLGIKPKPLRRLYPSLSAYIENRCLPSRNKLSVIIDIFEEKFNVLTSDFKYLAHNQINLISFMDRLNLSVPVISKEIGIHNSIIRRDWATQRFNAKPENIEKFYNILSSLFIKRASEINLLLQLLKYLANSDIYWDEIVEINRLDKPKYVYDLTIEESHNFIANNIFVHNSNVTDAICFVLGRLSIKSIRADKASSLIFAGSKTNKAMNEASVEMVFDNSDKTFSLEGDISIKRIVRNNGQSIYKINDEVRTRQEVLELLAQAGIDPNGFNIVLQGEITSLVKMSSEERRKVLEEVAGISVYETRKEKALSELDNTEEKLKEISSILRERTSYLKNLESERADALKFKQLEQTIEKCKASILHKKIEEKKKSLQIILEEIEKKQKAKEKQKEIIEKTQSEIAVLESKINEINLHIQKATGIEQEKLHSEVSDLRAELAGLTVKKENYSSRIQETERRKKELEASISIYEKDINELKKKSPLIAKKQEELEQKRKAFENIEDEKRKFYNLRSELNSTKARIDERKKQMQRAEANIDITLQQIEQISQGLERETPSSISKKIKLLREALESSNKQLKELQARILELEKLESVKNSDSIKLEKIKQDVSKIDICPLCQSKITPEHISHVIQDSNSQINKLHSELNSIKSENNEKASRILIISSEILQLQKDIQKSEVDLIKINNIEEKKQFLKNLEVDKKALDSELDVLDKAKARLEKTIEEIGDIDEKYHNLKFEIEEVKGRSEENLDTEIVYKERDLERTLQLIKRSDRDLQELRLEVKSLSQEVSEKSSLLEKKQEAESALSERFKKLFEERGNLQNHIKEKEKDMIRQQQELSIIDDNVNNSKIDKARVDAETQSLEIDFQPFSSVELLKMSMSELSERLEKSQQQILGIGNINMRALEVFEQVKQEYDQVYLKVEQLQKEKIEILKIIEEIDKKKKKTFLKTLEAINELFTRNFSQLSIKGTAFLQLEDEKEPFSAGLNIVIKVAQGKYFNVTSLSGGEQTLVALSLIFAIQEYRPYCFYILDEIDAALDKRNSERLASLLKKYMTAGQYIVITHNDAIISDSTTLYGVSMQEGISKIIGLKI